MKKILVIGAGFTGSTIARNLAEAGYTVDVVDKRDHVAGNAYDFVEEETNIRVHKYGPHIFHTNNDKVWHFLSRFADWIPYEHRVEALGPNGGYYPFPPNKTTYESFSSSKEKLLDVFFRPYTKKMWDKELEELDPNIINRVPMKIDSDENYYFSDKYQAMPCMGYTAMISNMLDHNNINVYLGFDQDPDDNYEMYDHVFNSAPIDFWYDFKFGILEYRSLNFKHVVVPKLSTIHPTTTVNFTTEGGPTRSTAWSKFPNSQNNRELEIVTYEYPCDFTKNNMERYYPVKDVDGKNKALYNKYASLDHGNMTFVGRCGKYVYIDMDQAVNQGLQISKKYIQENS
jgi:UDP-galactopyranose mutase